MTNVYPGGDFTGQDLSGQDLSGQDLRGCNFSRAILRGCNLKISKIDGAIFQGADLRSANMDECRGLINAAGADFSGASLVHADLERSWLQGARLVGVSASGVCLPAVNLSLADLTDADLSYAGLRDGPSFYRATLVRTSLKGAYIYAAQTYKADISGADLRDAEISNTSFQDVNLAGACFVAHETPGEMPEAKAVRSINKHAMYRAYQELLENLWRSRLSNATHPVGAFNLECEWIPDSSLEGKSARETKTPTKNDKLNFYTRCRSRIHCRSLIFRGLDGEAVPPDVSGVIDGGVELLQTRLVCSEDLARALIMLLKNSAMRETYGV